MAREPKIKLDNLAGLGLSLVTYSNYFMRGLISVHENIDLVDLTDSSINKSDARLLFTVTESKLSSTAERVEN